MAPRSELEIATASHRRLVKEETSYHKELAQLERRLDQLLAAAAQQQQKESGGATQADAIADAGADDDGAADAQLERDNREYEIRQAVSGQKINKTQEKKNTKLSLVFHHFP
jgi:small-conductance mechanosensitive channel